ncbi:hypothetical protein JM658_02310 [Joostella atrarenae]|uniref:Uncharacterized protein n=1 Tax=Joostella atrarenae TaxID=679257 RepID=A0ABS9IZP4_9FLAO|nr:hypothetical protein [Joostella atrarenae]
MIEKLYFCHESISDAEPGFKEAGIELKSSPLKTLKTVVYKPTPTKTKMDFNTFHTSIKVSPATNCLS